MVFDPPLTGDSKGHSMTRFRHLLVGFVVPLVMVPSGPKPEQKTTQGRNGMVVSVSAPASIIGRDILKKGGNAVDAAIATAFALAVTYPPAGNIGGGGFMVVYPADKRQPVVIEYRE